MAGTTEIINIALARLGESPIQSLDEGTVPANAAKLLFDSARQSALRDYNWSFALRMDSLARTDAEPVDFRYAFALPHGCLRAIRLRGESPFAVRGNQLFTDEERPVLEYVADVPDANDFDSKFSEVLSYKLASELAMPVKGSSELMAQFFNVYQTLIQQAASESAREQGNKGSDNPYLEARV
jgi:hypothetical protein